MDTRTVTAHIPVELAEAVDAAARIVDMLDSAADRLADCPEMGVELEIYDPLHVRSLIVGDYDMRYEIGADSISIVRLWHTREDR